MAERVDSGNSRSTALPKVMVLGFRGFPGIEGGIETHAENLYPLLSRLGCQIEAVVRSRYFPTGAVPDWMNIRFRRVWSPPPRLKGLETLVHSLLGVFYAVCRRPDVLHVHAIGPAIVVPLAKFFGLRVVFTHHGPDYDREKWGRIARFVLLCGEKLGARFSDQRISVSKTIAKMLEVRYGRESTVIPNGVRVQELPTSRAVLDELGLAPQRYLLQVSRMVPEKRQLDLIRAFNRVRPQGWKLVLVGGLHPVDDYVRKVVREAEATPGVVLAGFRSGRSLRELYGHAGLFVLPSTHEGLPIVILEALSFGLPVLASGIEANREVGLPADSYFTPGDIVELSQKIARCIGHAWGTSDKSRVRNWVRAHYDWQRIAEQTLEVYRLALCR